MKSQLGKLSPRRAIGIYVGDGSITVSQVAATVLGPVETFHHREACAADDLPNVMRRVVEPLLGKRRSRRRLVAFALPTLRIFMSTRPLRGANVEVSPHVLLHEMLRSPNSNVDDMAIDLMQGDPGKRPVVSLAACRKRYVANLLDQLAECNIRPLRVEPAMCALFRAAEQRHRAPRKAKSVIRLFWGAREGLAVLAVGGWPIAARSVIMPEQGPSAALISIVRTVKSLGVLCGAESTIDAVMIHGGAEFRDHVDLESVQQEVGAKIRWTDGPALDDGAIAFGVAVGCLQPGIRAFDLARAMKPRESLWEVVPWGELALQVAAVICLGLFLLHRSQSLNVSYAAVRSETAGRNWLAKMTDQQLDNEKKELTLRVDAIRKFLATRIVWTSYTHDLPARLPTNAKLYSFQGVCELEKPGRKDDKGIKPKKSFTMRIEAPIAQDGSAPKEIDGFLDSLRGHPLLKRDFPLVELADIKWFQPFVGAKPVAYFSIVCMPKPSGPGPAR